MSQDRQKDYWVGSGINGFSICSVVDQGGMPHGRKWQSDDLRPGDVGVSLRLDCRNAPAMTVEQKEVVARQIELFAQQALQHLQIAVPAKYPLSAGDYVVSTGSGKPWLGKVVQTSDLGIKVHQVFDLRENFDRLPEREHDELFDDETLKVSWIYRYDLFIERKPLVFMAWSKLEVTVLGQEFKDVARAYLNDSPEFNAVRQAIGEKTVFEMVNYLAGYDSDFNLTQLDYYQLTEWFDELSDCLDSPAEDFSQSFRGFENLSYFDQNFIFKTLFSEKWLSHKFNDGAEYDKVNQCLCQYNVDRTQLILLLAEMWQEYFKKRFENTPLLAERSVVKTFEVKSFYHQLLAIFQKASNQENAHLVFRKIIHFNDDNAKEHFQQIVWLPLFKALRDLKHPLFEMVAKTL